MPQVPSAIAPSVAPSANTGIGYQNANGATPDAFGAGIGQAQQGTAQAVDHLGGVFATHAEKMQADVNASAAKDLFLQGDVAVGKLTVEYNSLEGANRVNAYPGFVEAVGKIRQDTIASAPNDKVAKLFDADFSKRVGYSIVDGARSAASANKQYQNQTNEAVRTNALGHIAAQANDDNRFSTELEIGKQTFQNSDEYKGSSPEVRAQRDEAFVSSAWATRLQAMSRTDPLRSRELLTKNKDSIDGVTQLKLQDSINQQIINVQSRVDSDQIVQSGALVSPELKSRIKAFEGYTEKPYSDFKQTSVGYGTKAQPGDENIPADQRKAVYEARFENEVGRAANIVDQFSPGLPKGTRDALISLTYNAGSAWTSAGLGQQVRAGNFESARGTLQQYNKAGGEVNDGLVSRRASEASWFGGDPVNRDKSLDSAMEKAKEQAVKVFPDDPGNQAKYLDTLQSRIRSDASVMQSSAKDMQLQIRNQVYTEVLDPSKNITSYDQLSEKARTAFDIAPPELQNNIRKQMTKNATQDVPYTAERRSLGDTLVGESINEPDKFMARDISSLDLTRVQKSDFLKKQADRKALVEKGVKLSGAMSSLQPLLNDAGIGKSASDPTKNAEYNKFSGVLDQQLSDFVAKNQRPPNDKEVREMGAGLLKDVVTSPGYVFDSKAKAYSVVADKTPITLRTDNPNEHYANLPKGATFIGPDGQKRIKQ